MSRIVALAITTAYEEIIFKKSSLLIVLSNFHQKRWSFVIGILGWLSCEHFILSSSHLHLADLILISFPDKKKLSGRSLINFFQHNWCLKDFPMFNNTDVKISRKILSNILQLEQFFYKCRLWTWERSSCLKTLALESVAVQHR